MILREHPTQTLKELRESMEGAKSQSKVLSNADLRVDLTEGRTIALGDEIEVPATKEGIKAIGDWVQVPSSFLARVDADIQEYLLRNLLSRQGQAQANVLYTDEGIELVRDPKVKFIEPKRIVGIAAKVIDDKALVAEHWNTMDEFRLDVIAPEGFDRGIGGDKKVGDLTRGGIRIGQDRKHNLAPWVSEFMYRLACTNGMERFDEGLRVDARGSSVEEVLAEFEAMADRAFRRVEKTIASFYELRDQKLDNPERVLVRVAEEQNISSRHAMEMIETIPSIEGDFTMFDLVNLVTNQANEPTLKAGPRRALQMAGGNVVSEHAARCSHCQSKLAQH